MEYNNDLFASVTARTELITPQIAVEYLSHNKGNRTLSQNAVKRYAQEMLHGNWKMNGQGIHFDKEGNLVNGQHRLSAVVQAGISVPMLVIRGVEDGSFATYDCGKARNRADVFSIEGIMNSHQVAGVVAYYLVLADGRTAMSSKIDKVSSKVHTGAYSHIDLLACYHENEDTFQWATLIAKVLNKRAKAFPLRMMGGLAAYLVLRKGEASELIEQFFACFVDSGKRGDFSMFERLKDVFFNADSGRAGRLTEEMKLRYIARIWNAYKEDRNLSFNSIRYDETTKKSWFK